MPNDDKKPTYDAVLEAGVIAQRKAWAAEQRTLSETVATRGMTAGDQEGEVDAFAVECPGYACVGPLAHPERIAAAQRRPDYPRHTVGFAAKRLLAAMELARDRETGEYASDQFQVEIIQLQNALKREYPETPTPDALAVLRKVAELANEAAEEALFDDLDSEWQITRSTLDRLLEALYATGIRKKMSAHTTTPQGEVKP